MTMRTSRIGGLAALLALLGCGGGTPGARPEDMSAAGHQTAADQEEQAAADHQAQFDPKAAAEQTGCRPGRNALRRIDYTDDTCWTSVTNPTVAHLRAAEEHRKRAADHRAASAALVEAKACVGIAQDDRDMSPFEHTEDIASVAPLSSLPRTALSVGRKFPDGPPAGAVVTFRAVPGLTTEWLQRLIDCHLARNAALGHDVPEMPDCPLVPAGVEARVTSTGDGFAVALRSESPETAREVLARAQRLMPAPPGGK
jgi:hypothetical protein